MTIVQVLYRLLQFLLTTNKQLRKKVWKKFEWGLVDHCTGIAGSYTRKPFSPEFFCCCLLNSQGEYTGFQVIEGANGDINYPPPPPQKKNSLGLKEGPKTIYWPKWNPQKIIDWIFLNDNNEEQQYFLIGRYCLFIYHTIEINFPR